MRGDFGSSYSGVVIAGFGRTDLFPAIRCYLFGGVVLDRAVFQPQENKCATIDFSTYAVVVPFAQDDMACLFMEGIDRQFRTFLNDLMVRVFSPLPQMIVELLAECLGQSGITRQAGLSEIVERLLRDIKDESQQYMQDNHVQPIINRVGQMSKDELAVMAETLVNLTAFKRKTTMATETVGGPVDVAVISRGDGFIWIKRKHYFDSALNHHFFSNYFRLREE